VFCCPDPTEKGRAPKRAAKAPAAPAPAQLQGKWGWTQLLGLWLDLVALSSYSPRACSYGFKFWDAVQLLEGFVFSVGGFSRQAVLIHVGKKADTGRF